MKHAFLAVLCLLVVTHCSAKKKARKERKADMSLSSRDCRYVKPNGRTYKCRNDRLCHMFWWKIPPPMSPGESK